MRQRMTQRKSRTICEERKDSGLAPSSLSGPGRNNPGHLAALSRSRWNGNRPITQRGRGTCDWSGQQKLSDSSVSAGTSIDFHLPAPQHGDHGSRRDVMQMRLRYKAIEGHTIRES